MTDRIVIHWTAGGHTVSTVDRKHYHLIIDGAGKVHLGNWPISANDNIVSGKYAAHTLNANTGAIGISVAAMAGAIERPFNAGNAPIKQVQIDALVKECARLCKQYNIPVTKTQVLTHAEVQPTLGIKQRGKWDITWLPGMSAPADPIAVGNKLRALIHAEMTPTIVTTVTPPKPVAPPAKPAAPSESWLVALIKRLFGRKRT